MHRKPSPLAEIRQQCASAVDIKTLIRLKNISFTYFTNPFLTESVRASIYVQLDRLLASAEAGDSDSESKELKEAFASICRSKLEKDVREEEMLKRFQRLIIPPNLKNKAAAQRKPSPSIRVGMKANTETQTDPELLVLKTNSESQTSQDLLRVARLSSGFNADGNAVIVSDATSQTTTELLRAARTSAGITAETGSQTDAPIAANTSSQTPIELLLGARASAGITSVSGSQTDAAVETNASQASRELLHSARLSVGVVTDRDVQTDPLVDESSRQASRAPTNIVSHKVEYLDAPSRNPSNTSVAFRTSNFSSTNHETTKTAAGELVASEPMVKLKIEPGSTTQMATPAQAPALIKQDLSNHAPSSLSSVHPLAAGLLRSNAATNSIPTGQPFIAPITPTAALLQLRSRSGTNSAAGSTSSSPVIFSASPSQVKIPAADGRHGVLTSGRAAEAKAGPMLVDGGAAATFSRGGAARTELLDAGSPRPRSLASVPVPSSNALAAALPASQPSRENAATPSKTKLSYAQLLQAGSVADGGAPYPTARERGFVMMHTAQGQSCKISVHSTTRGHLVEPGSGQALSSPGLKQLVDATETRVMGLARLRQ
ncbi:hypothetical protein HK405_006218, partial [Cladochytrium tenue]